MSEIKLRRIKNNFFLEINKSFNTFRLIALAIGSLHPVTITTDLYFVWYSTADVAKLSVDPETFLSIIIKDRIVFPGAPSIVIILTANDWQSCDHLASKAHYVHSSIVDVI